MNFVRNIAQTKEKHILYIVDSDYISTFGHNLSSLRAVMQLYDFKLEGMTFLEVGSIDVWHLT